MPVIPQIQSQQLPDTDRGGMPRPQISTAPGRALAQLGGTVQAIGLDLDADRERMEDTSALIGLRREQVAGRALLDEKRQGISEDGIGFSQDYTGTYEQRLKKFVEKLPKRLQTEYTQRTTLLSETMQLQAMGIERDQNYKFADNGVNEALDDLRIVLDQNPGAFEKVLAQGEKDIDNIGSVLPEAYREQRKETWREQVALTRELARVRTDPQYARRYTGQGRESYYASIRQAESGGNDNAKNPKSSATGRYQFITGTWKRLVRQYPQAGLTPDGRTDGTQQEIAIRLLTAENEAVLARNGIAASHGNLYAAHFLGPQGAVSVLQSGDDEMVKDIVSPAVIKANSFLRPMTVAKFRAWANRKATGKTAPEDRIPSDLSFADYQQVQGAALKIQSQQYSARKESFDLGIVTGDVSNEDQILLDPVLDDGDKASLIRAFRTENKDKALIAGILNGVNSGSGGGRLNPFDADQRRAGDKAYDAMVRDAAPEEIGGLADRFIQGTGYVPKKYIAGIRNGLNSRNQQEIVAALELSQRTRDVAGTALEAVEGGKEVRDAAIAYRSYVDRGMSAEEAAERYMEMNSPEAIERRSRLKEPAKEFVEDLSVSEVTNAFDTLFTSEPAPGLTPAQELEIMADYAKFAEEAFYSTGGDPDLARDIALEDMKRIYGVTTINGRSSGSAFGVEGSVAIAGRPTLMKYPPENFYPAIGGNHDYLRDEVIKDAEVLHGKPVRGVQLWPTRETTDDVRSGRPPRYILRYQDDKGVWHEDNSKLFEMPAEGVEAAMEVDRTERIVEAERVRSVAQGQRTKAEILANERKNIGNILRGRDTSLEQSVVRAREMEQAEQASLEERLPRMSLSDIQEWITSNNISTYPQPLLQKMLDRYKTVKARNTRNENEAAFRRFDREIMDILTSSGAVE